MKHSSRQAFTLIELLVVIAIIGVLSTILFPAIGTALGMAKKAQCKSAMRSVHGAIMLYGNDHSFRLPGGGTGATHGTGLFPVQNMRITGHTMSIMTYIQDILAGQPLQPGDSNSYGDGGRIKGTYCESNREGSADIHSPVWLWNARMDKISGGSEQPWGSRDAEFFLDVEPEDKWIFTDFDQEHPDVSPSDGWFSFAPPNRVHSTWNRMFFDGHVEDYR